MKKLLLVLFISSLIYSLNSQTDTTIWNDMSLISKDNYELSIPKKWRLMDMSANGLGVYLEASGLAYPYSYNNSPFILVLFIYSLEEKSLEEAKESVQKGYSENNDRVFPDNFTYESEPCKLISGEDAYIVNTRFYRKSKGLNTKQV